MNLHTLLDNDQNFLPDMRLANSCSKIKWCRINVYGDYLIHYSNARVVDE